MSASDPTLDLLRRWHQGDSEALGILVQRNLAFIRSRVRKRLGPELRARAESGDFVQDALVQFLRFGPRFLLGGEGQLRAFLARVVENVLCDRHDWFTARRRDLHRERPLPEGSVLGLDPAARSVTRPDSAAEKSEEEAWIRLALELLDPEDRRAIVLRVYEDLSFAEMGARLGLQESGARMRFNRAMPRLARKLEALRNGSLEQALGAESDHGPNQTPEP